MRCLIAITLLALILSCKNKRDKKIIDTEPTDLIVQPENQEYDSLKKYSYILVGINNKGGIVDRNGTGFFIRHLNKLYLVSNRHVFLQYHTFKKKKYSDNDIVKLAFITDCPHEADGRNPIIIDLNQFSKEPLWGHYEKPDLFIYEIKYDLKGDKIYSIENLMLHNGLEAQKGGSIFSFGYPTIEFKKNVKNYLNTQPSLLKMNLLKNPNEAYLMKDGNNMSTYYYTSNPNLEQGRSGSPVFFKSPINSRMYFLGILAAGDSTKKESYIVKYRELINELKNVK